MLFRSCMSCTYYRIDSKADFYFELIILNNFRNTQPHMHDAFLNIYYLFLIKMWQKETNRDKHSMWLKKYVCISASYAVSCTEIWFGIFQPMGMQTLHICAKQCYNHLVLCIRTHCQCRYCVPIQQHMCH